MYNIAVELPELYLEARSLCKVVSSVLKLPFFIPGVPGRGEHHFMSGSVQGGHCGSDTGRQGRLGNLLTAVTTVPLIMGGNGHRMPKISKSNRPVFKTTAVTVASSTPVHCSINGQHHYIRSSMKLDLIPPLPPSPSLMQAIPHNIFIVGACNPHRGNSLAAYDTWVRGSYYVRQLHPTLQCLMWDYGALGEHQEREYILAKMKMSSGKKTSNADLANHTDLIVTSQNLLREYAFEQLKSYDMPDSEASACSRSCVSQRDIQRLFTFHDWLTKMYKKFKPCGKSYEHYGSRAVVVALGLVYYLRLDSKHRKKYMEVLDHHTTISRVTFSKAFKEELDWYINHIDLPEGIAKTQALKENLFATIICTMTHTPLIIVGPPGSSKTLSFNLALANLKGQESKVEIFRKTDIFRSLDPQTYQCSRRTTSNEISTVFSRAINRQRSHTKVPLPVYCVVFMDEAGLPQERHESLKVLHYFLDRQEVSFLAISNHVLDAAKTNRAVSLFRPESTPEDLVTLAKGCLCPTPDNPPVELKRDLEIVASFCPAYTATMQLPECKGFFGLRDFIHFISYLRRKRLEMLSPQLVMEALERNFNGVSRKCFKNICKLFLRAVSSVCVEGDV